MMVPTVRPASVIMVSASDLSPPITLGTTMLAENTARAAVAGLVPTRMAMLVSKLPRLGVSVIRSFDPLVWMAMSNPPPGLAAIAGLVPRAIGTCVSWLLLLGSTVHR